MFAGILVEYPCPHDGCRSKLADRAALKAHYREQHGEPGAPHYRCPFESCRSSFSTLSLLHGHQVAHHEGQTPAAMYSCEYPNCDKVNAASQTFTVFVSLYLPPAYAGR